MSEITVLEGNDNRKLAIVSEIASVDLVPGADRLEVVTMSNNSWQVVTAKGSFLPKQKCVYFEIDSALPEEERYEFLKERCSKTLDGKTVYRLRTIKLKGCISQGLCLPLSEFPEIAEDVEVGTDVTEVLNVKLYRKPVSDRRTFLSGFSGGDFPTHLCPKTDETRIQAYSPEQVFRFFGNTFELTEKLDGTSCTMIAHKVDGAYTLTVCSRNNIVKPSGKQIVKWTVVEDGVATENEKEVDVQSVYWNMAEKYHIKSRLVEWCGKYERQIALQGEIIGPGIQSNRQKISDVCFRVFHIYDVDRQRYLLPSERKDVLEEINSIPIYCVSEEHTQELAPVIAHVPSLEYRKLEPTLPMLSQAINNLNSQEEIWNEFRGYVVREFTKQLLEEADGQGFNNCPREGLVFKSCVDPRCSFKVVSNAYLLKESD